MNKQFSIDSLIDWGGLHWDFSTRSHLHRSLPFSACDFRCRSIVHANVYCGQLVTECYYYPARGCFFYPSQRKAKGGGGVKKFCIGIGRDVTPAFVTSFSSHTSEARGLKFSMLNPHMDGSKVNDQIFDILPRS